MIILEIEDISKKTVINVEFDDINDAIDAKSLIDLAVNCILTKIITTGEDDEYA